MAYCIIIFCVSFPSIDDVQTVFNGDPQGAVPVVVTAVFRVEGSDGAGDRDVFDQRRMFQRFRLEIKFRLVGPYLHTGRADVAREQNAAGAGMDS